MFNLELVFGIGYMIPFNLRLRQSKKYDKFLEILSKISFSNLGLNWLDLVIIIVIAFYALEGYSLGFIAALLDLIGFVLSFIIGLKLTLFQKP